MKFWWGLILRLALIHPLGFFDFILFFNFLGSFISFILFSLGSFFLGGYEILLVPLLGKLKLENLYVSASVDLSLVVEKT